MGELVEEKNSHDVDKVQQAHHDETNVFAVAESMLAEVRGELAQKETKTIPLSELSTMGGGLSSMKEQILKIEETVFVYDEGLLRAVNLDEGCELIARKKDNHLDPFFKNGAGKRKMAVLDKAGPIEAKKATDITLPTNPAMMLMAASLYSIEQQLGRIEEMQEKMLSFLQMEKESAIEADLETMMSMLSKYKLNWDNEQFVAGNHKLVLDIQRSARQNMNFYQKQVEEAVNNKKLFVAQSNVNTTLTDLQKKFQYYQMSLYTFSMASMLEIMLSGNYQEANIEEMVSELRKLSSDYRKHFDLASAHIEKLGDAAVGTTVMKGVGNVGKAMGKMIGAIPIVNKGPVDEFLQDKGMQIKEAADTKERSAARTFAGLSNPGNNVFTEKLEDMCKIYNHTEAIYFDHENIYLVGDEPV